MQIEIFTGEELKERGIEQAMQPDARKNVIEWARNVARVECLNHGTVTSDDVVQLMESSGIDLPGILGNGMGSIFRTKEFVPTGGFRKSKRPSRHAAMVRVWRLKR